MEPNATASPAIWLQERLTHGIDAVEKTFPLTCLILPKKTVDFSSRFFLPLLKVLMISS
jgi:hypothetical protein